jgi:hypothetical protein
MRGIKKLYFFYSLFRAFGNGILESALKAILFLYTRVYLRPRVVARGFFVK